MTPNLNSSMQPLSAYRFALLYWSAGAWVVPKDKTCPVASGLGMLPMPVEFETLREAEEAIKNYRAGWPIDHWLIVELVERVDVATTTQISVTPLRPVPLRPFPTGGAF